MKYISHVLIYGINYTPELTGIGKYNAGMAEYMIQKGIKCTVITSFPFYPQWKLQSPYKKVSYKKEIFYDGQLIIYRCPIYIPGNPTGIKRILQETSFLLSSFVIILKYIFKNAFDAFIVVSPPFYIGLPGLIYKLFKKTKLVYHIQDLQIELARETNLIKHEWIIKLMLYIERYILLKADYVSTISDGMIRKIKIKKNINVIHLPNWVDTKSFYPVHDSSLSRIKWNFTTKDKIILYSGNIGEKQGLDNVLSVAQRFHNLPDYKFLICGNGAYKNRLIQKAKEMRVPNVLFMPLQPLEEFNKFLNIADVHLILNKEGSDDLVMPSKLTTILAVGGQVIATAMPQTALYNMLTENNIGTVIKPDDLDQLHLAILNTIRDDKKKTAIARNFALKNLSYESIMNRFLINLELKHE